MWSSKLIGEKRIKGEAFFGFRFEDPSSSPLNQTKDELFFFIWLRILLGFLYEIFFRVKLLEWSWILKKEICKKRWKKFNHRYFVFAEKGKEEEESETQVEPYLKFRSSMCKSVQVQILNVTAG